jgi:hypothetical protein
MPMAHPVTQMLVIVADHYWHRAQLFVSWRLELKAGHLVGDRVDNNSIAGR